MQELTEQIRRLEAAIIEQDALRPVLGNAVADLAIGAMRAQITLLRTRLAAMQPTVESAPVASEARRVVSVLFAEVVLYTQLAEMLDAEDLHDALLVLWADVERIVLAHGGAVNQRADDFMLILFGAPQALEAHAELAVRAALAMQAAVAARAPEFNVRFGRTINLQIGVNSGEVLTTIIDQDEAGRKYTVMGTAVNVASRIEKLAAPGRVVIGPMTHRLTAPLFTYEPLGDVVIKGLAQALPLYAVTGVNVGVRPARGLAGPRAPLVGRTLELAQVMQALTMLSTGRGQIVCVLGEAGVGKSRLVAEAHMRYGQDKLRWCEVRARAYGQAPLAPALGFLAALCEVAPGAPLAELARGLQDTTHRLGLGPAEASTPTLAAWLTAPMSPLAGVGGLRAPQILRVDALGQQRQFLQEFMLLVTVLAAEKPTLFMLDDAHWAEAATLALIEQIAALADRGQVGLVLCLRAETGSSGWQMVGDLIQRHARAVTAIHLAPLEADAADALLTHWLGAQSNPEWRAGLLARAEGNPLFLEEVVRAAQESGAEAHVERRDETPVSLRALFTARVDRLPANARQVIQLAAVVGRVSAVAVLNALMAGERGAARETLPAALSMLEEAGLLQRDLDTGEPAYRFVQGLAQETIYQDISLRRRRQIHMRIAQAMETLYATALSEHVAALAHHYDQAGARVPAMDYLVQAAEQACATFAQRAALTYLERAMALAAEARDEQDAEWLARLRLRWAYLSLQLQEPARALVAARGAAESPLPAIRAEAWWLMANAYFQKDLGEGLRHLEDALTLARAHNEWRILARALAWYGCLGVWGGRLARREEGEAYLREAATLALAQGDETFWLDCFDAYKDIAAPEDEREAYARALDLARARNDQRTVVSLLSFQADLCARIGEHAAAVTNSELAQAAGLDEHPLRPFCLRAWGWALFNLGEWEVGLPYLVEALALFQQLDLRSRIAGAYLRVCLAHQELGQPLGEAVAEAERWLTAARVIAEPAEEGYALADLAWLAARGGDRSRTESLMAEARALLVGAIPWWYEVGILELLAEADLVLGNFARVLETAVYLAVLGERMAVREVILRALTLRAQASTGAGRSGEAQVARVAGMALATELGHVRLYNKLVAMPGGLAVHSEHP